MINELIIAFIIGLISFIYSLYIKINDLEIKMTVMENNLLIVIEDSKDIKKEIHDFFKAKLDES